MRRVLCLSLMAAMTTTLGSCTAPDERRERLKQELKAEILAELAAGGRGAAPRSPADQAPATGAQAEAVSEQGPSAGTKPVAVPTGNVTGRVLLGQRELAGCRVRLLRLEGGSGLTGLLSGYRETVAFDTVTKRNGIYEFVDVPAGAYRLKWLPEGERGWIRRLSDKPDVLVEEGKTSTAADFHAGRPLLVH